jgi:hypothetical protein
MRLPMRIERLEARVPRSPMRVILVWVDEDGGTIKAADSHPNLPDSCQYDEYLSPYQPGGGTHAAQAH